ncbi:hypothetical protein [Streptomyces sp. NPDC044948]|uniref:hypothetical protein n=1 Tax=Streptomyces sp. NPDC044948 TaxID=3157092 RepID=UPI0033ED3225
MIDTILPPLFAAASITLTYVFCIRPMRQGRGCHMTPQQSQKGHQQSCHSATGTAQTPEAESTDSEIARLREEVQLLHHELDLRTGQDEVRIQKGESR